MEFFGIGLSDRPAEFAPRLRKAREKALAFMRPKPCPYPLERVGGAADGAYLLPTDFDGIEACVSPGVNNYKPFEDEILERFGIKSHMCDRSSDEALFRTPLVKDKQTFRKSGSTWTEARRLCRWPFFAKPEKQFPCVHAHPNNCLPGVEIQGTGFRMPTVIELTLLRNDRLEGFPPEAFVAPELPHPLDLPANMLRRPPIALADHWLDGPPPRAKRSRRASASRCAPEGAATQSRATWRRRSAFSSTPTSPGARGSPSI